MGMLSQMLLWQIHAKCLGQDVFEFEILCNGLFFEITLILLYIGPFKQENRAWMKCIFIQNND